MSRVHSNVSALWQLAAHRRAAGGAAVLAYHDVSADDRPDNVYSVSASMLRTHIRVIRRLGLQIVDLAQIVDRIERGASVDGLAALTFDDGLVGVYRNALTVLDVERAPATIFVVPGSLGVEPPWWPGAQRTMTVDELRECARCGVRLEAHSLLHRSLPSLVGDDLVVDLAANRSRHGELFGDPPTLLAYPFGHHDSRVRAASNDAGFRAGFTFLNGRARPSDDLFRLPRLAPWRGMRAVTLARHLARKPETWPDHQVGRVLDGGPK
jgi:peptidoglycan/xylan/chitin deacetylase (PgdA/CDA1 family)